MAATSEGCRVAVCRDFLLERVSCMFRDKRLSKSIAHKAWSCASQVLRAVSAKKMRKIYALWRAYGHEETRRAMNSRLGTADTHPWSPDFGPHQQVSFRVGGLPGQTATLGRLVLILLGRCDLNLRYMSHPTLMSERACLDTDDTALVANRLGLRPTYEIGADELEVIWGLQRFLPSLHWNYPYLGRQACGVLRQLIQRDSDLFSPMLFTITCLDADEVRELLTDPHVTSITICTVAHFYVSSRPSPKLCVNAYPLDARLRGVPKGSLRRCYEERYVSLVNHNRVPPAGSEGALDFFPAADPADHTVRTCASAIAARGRLERLNIDAFNLTATTELVTELLALGPLDVDAFEIATSHDTGASSLARHLLPALAKAAPRCRSFVVWSAAEQARNYERARAARKVGQTCRPVDFRRRVRKAERRVMAVRERMANEAWRGVADALASYRSSAPGSPLACLPLHAHSISNRLRAALDMLPVPASVNFSGPSA